MLSKPSAVFAALLWLLSAPSGAVGKTITVAPDGTAGAAGSESDPSTLTNANEEVQAGDVVVLLAGAYDENIQPEASGTADAPIVYSAAPGAVMLPTSARRSMTQPSMGARTSE